MLKIGEFTDTFYPIVDGVGRVVYNYAVQLDAKGHECYIVAPMAKTGYLGHQPYHLVEFTSVDVPTQKQYQTGIPLSDLHYLKKIQQIPLDVIHAHSPFVAGQEALRLAIKRNIPLIGEFHSKYYDDFYQYTRQERLANLGVRWIVDFYSRCDEVWTVSNSSAETLHEYGYTGDIVIIPNGTPDVHPDPENKKAAMEMYHLTDEYPILMYCGQINWKKNLLRILESLAIVKSNGYRFRFVMAGQGPNAEEVHQKVEELGLSDNILFTGLIHSDLILNGLYEASTLFVFPSLYDTSGIVVREAASVGTASVVVEGSAPAEVIRDGIDGLYCQDTNASLSGKIMQILDHPGYAKQLGNQARQDIYLPWSDVLDMSLERYRNLVGKGHRKKKL